MLVYLSCLFTCQLRDLTRNFPCRTPPPPTDNCGFFRTVKNILITAISENSSFLAKSLWRGGSQVDRKATDRVYAGPRKVQGHHTTQPITETAGEGFRRKDEEKSRR